jgi:hypothetical protein
MPAPSSHLGFHPKLPKRLLQLPRQQRRHVQHLALRTIHNLVPSATTIASGFSRTAGSKLASATCMDTSKCLAS